MVERQIYAMCVCIAKTPRSLSDDPHQRGRPADHVLTACEVRIATGSGGRAPGNTDIKESNVVLDVRAARKLRARPLAHS